MILEHPLKTSIGLIVALALLVGFGPGEARADFDLTPNAKIKKAYVDTQWGQVHYRYTTGPKNAPVLVMLHQTSSDSQMFEKVMARLGKYYSRIIAPDFPGYGETFPIDENKGIPFYADVFMESLDNLGVKQFHLVGYIPRRLPHDAPQDERYDLPPVVGEEADFSPDQLLRGWADLLTIGIKPCEVRVLGFGGGPLSALEYRIALALGATVGVAMESGGEADALIGDPLWADDPNLLPLPYDTATIRARCAARRPPHRPSGAPKATATAARASAERRRPGRRPADPAC